MSHTLYVTDLDGTLLNSNSQVSSTSAEIISRLSARGVMITAATARTPATVQPLLAKCNLRLPVITFTGAAEWDMQSQQFSHVDFLPSQYLEPVQSLLAACGLNPMHYIIAPDGMIHSYYFGGMPSQAEASFMDARSSLALKRIHINDDPLPSYANERTVLFFALGDVATVDQAASLLRAQTPCHVMAYTDALLGEDVAMLEVFAPGVSKAAAVERLAARLAADKIVVFGDNLNDLSMMSVATEAVAVENAVEQVRAKADTIIGPNTSDAVARFIEDRENSLRG